MGQRGGLTKSAPPKSIEAVAQILTPPACREYVIGDLHERYTSIPQYLGDVLSTLPLVIASRIRRTTDLAVLLMEAFAVYLSFIAAPWYVRDTAFLYDDRGLLRVAIPTAVTLLALVLGDAYAVSEKRSTLKSIQEGAFGVGFAFLFEAALSAGNPDLALPRWIMVSGGCLSLLLISTLRILFQPDGKRPRGAT